MTSASDDRPPMLAILHIEPRGSARSAASIVSPLIDCTLPVTRNGMDDSTASSCAERYGTLGPLAGAGGCGHQVGDDSLELPVELRIGLSTLAEHAATAGSECFVIDELHVLQRGPGHLQLRQRFQEAFP